MKQKSSFVIVYWWLLTLLICGGLLLCFAEKEERVSQSENRILSGFPQLTARSLASGEFFLGIESYLSDGMWGRDRIVGISESILGFFSANSASEREMLEGAAMQDELQGVKSDASTGSEAASQPSLQETEPAPEAEEVRSPEALTGYGLWRIREDGTYVRFLTGSEKDVQEVAQALNSFRSCLPEDGHLFYTNVPVTSTGRGALEEYTGWYDNIDLGLSQYTDQGIHIINTPALLEAPLWNGEHIYFASDHHWTPRGAMLVANECIRQMGLPVLSFDEYDYDTYTFVMTVKNASDDLELLHPLQPVTGHVMDRGKEGDSRVLINYGLPTYRAFLDGDSVIWLRYDTGFSTGRKALVVGDSFSNAFTPYLLPYYDEVYKVDIRNYDARSNGGTMAQLMEQYGIDDAYIIVCHPNGITTDMSKTNLETALHG